MADGDAAAAAGMDTVAGTDDLRESYKEINKTRDYIVEYAPDIIPVSGGGTGASSAATARGNLGITSVNIPTSTPGSNVQNDLNYVGGLATAASSAAAAANTNANNRMPYAGGTFSGDIYLPASSAATSGWTVCYINSDGRVCRGSSSERYKKNIHDAPDLGNLFAAPLREYGMRVDGKVPDDHAKHIGYVAEELVGTDLERFVVVLNGQVESIDFIAMLMAQVAQLNARLEAAGL